MKRKETQKEDKQFCELLKRISQNDKNALESLYESYGRLMYTTALVITKSSYLADEIVDDVLIKIWQSAATYPKIKNPRGWLYIITANCAKDKLKSKKEVTELFDIPHNDSNIEEIIENDAFYNMIAFLSESEQQIMIFRFIEDMSFEKIAKVLGKSVSTVSSSYYRVIEKLKNKN